MASRLRDGDLVSMDRAEEGTGLKTSVIKL